jgi:hypothetical protein
MINTGKHQSINNPFQEVMEHSVEKSSHKSFDALRTLYRYEDIEELNKQWRRLHAEEKYEKR